jgi:hypothetical protein
METKKRFIRHELEQLLLCLGWATDPDREGRMLPAELMILRRRIYQAYRSLDFQDGDLPAEICSYK